MNRQEFRAAYRQARLVLALFERYRPTKWLHDFSLADGLPRSAVSAALKYGDQLKFKAWRMRGEPYISRVSGHKISRPR